MKKTILIAFIAMIFFACTAEKKENANMNNPEQYGYTILKSANIDIVKEINIDLTNYDFVKLRSHYTDSTKVHDNLNVQQIDTNLAGFLPMKNAGVKFGIEGVPEIFEIIEKPDAITGYTNYVDTYYVLSLTRNGKKYLSSLNQMFAMKDGKVLEEWDVYDTAPFTELMK